MWELWLACRLVAQYFHCTYLHFFKAKNDARSKLLLSQKVARGKANMKALVTKEANVMLASLLADRPAQDPANHTVDHN